MIELNREDLRDAKEGLAGYLVSLSVVPCFPLHLAVAQVVQATFINAGRHDSRENRAEMSGYAGLCARHRSRRPFSVGTWRATARATPGALECLRRTLHRMNGSLGSLSRPLECAHHCWGRTVDREQPSVGALTTFIVGPWPTHATGLDGRSVGQTKRANTRVGSPAAILQLISERPNWERLPSGSFSNLLAYLSTA